MRLGDVCVWGFDPLSLRQTLERALLPRLELVHARLVPIGGLAFRTNAGFALCTSAWHPFVLASVTTIPLLFDRDQRHIANDIRVSNILSRYNLCLTDIYSINNILLR